MDILDIKIDKIFHFKLKVRKLIKKINFNTANTPSAEIKDILATIKVFNISIHYISTPDNSSLILFQSFMNTILPLLKELAGNNIGSFYYRGRIGNVADLKINITSLICPILIIKILFKEWRKKHKWKKNFTKKSEEV